MTVSVTMPALGESVTEGTVTRWLKQEGDSVQADEPLLEVSTDKVDTEIPAPASGVLVRIVAREDETVEVGGELAVIGDSADGGGTTEAAPQAVAEPTAATEPTPEPQAAAPTEQPAPEPPSTADAQASQPAAAAPAPASGGTPVVLP